MKALFVLAFVVLGVAQWTWSAEGTPLSAEEMAGLLKRAQASQDAFDKGDADTVLALTHRSIVKLVGSEEKLEKAMRQAVKEFSGKFPVISREWGEPSPLYVAGTEEICFLPRTTVIQGSEQRVRVTGYIVAGRKRGTGDWLFLDGAGFKEKPEILWQLFPELPRGIVAPPFKAEPVP